MANKLNLVVTDCGTDPTAPPAPTRKYTGTARRHGHAASRSSIFAGAEEHRYEFSVALDGSAVNNVPGRHPSATFTWDAV